MRLGKIDFIISKREGDGTYYGILFPPHPMDRFINAMDPNTGDFREGVRVEVLEPEDVRGR